MAYEQVRTVKYFLGDRQACNASRQASTQCKLVKQWDG